MWDKKFWIKFNFLSQNHNICALSCANRTPSVSVLKIGSNPDKVMLTNAHGGYLLRMIAGQCIKKKYDKSPLSSRQF